MTIRSNDFKLVIFDIDGTLTSSNELIFASFNHIYGKYFNKTLTPKEITGLFGPTEEQIINRFFGENAPNAIEEYFSFYDSNHNLAQLYNGIHSLLSELNTRGKHIAAFTGKGRRAAQITLKRLEIEKFFGELISGDDVVRQKPSGEGISKLLSKYGVTNQEALMIGDSTADLIAARENNVKIASVIWDSYSQDQVIRLKPDYLFRTVADLNNFLLNGHN